MTDPIIIAGAGIAGLTAALALQPGAPFASASSSALRSLRKSAPDCSFHRTPPAFFSGWASWNVLEPRAVRPDAVMLRRASDLRALASVPLGDFAEQPVESALSCRPSRGSSERAAGTRSLERVSIELTTGANVRQAALSPDSVSVSVEIGGKKPVSTDAC